MDRRVWSLSDQRLKWDLELVRKRRDIPSGIEELVANLEKQQVLETAEDPVREATQCSQFVGQQSSEVVCFRRVCILNNLPSRGYPSEKRYDHPISRFERGLILYILFSQIV